MDDIAQEETFGGGVTARAMRYQRLLRTIGELWVLFVMMATGHAVYGQVSMELEGGDDPRFSPLASQCGFEAAYIALRTTAHKVSLAELTAGYVGNLQVQTEGLSVGELSELLRGYGLRCEEGIISKETFDKVSYTDSLLIVVVVGRYDPHFEVVLGAKGRLRLLSNHGRRETRWVDSDDLYEAMTGPGILVYRGGERARRSYWYLFFLVPGAAIILASSVAVPLRKRLMGTVR